MEFLEMLLITIVMALLIAFWIRQSAVTVEVTAVAGGKAKNAVAARHLGKHDGKTEKTSVKAVTGGEVDHAYAFDKAGEECPKQPAVPRGHCYIFNNKNFKNMPKRTGTDHDKDGLTKIFKELKFEVSEFNDKEADDMMTEIQNLSKEKHSQYDCVVLIFLTHGKDGRIYGSDDDSLTVDDITTLFKADRCQSLACKPQIFFFASCRGMEFPKDSAGHTQTARPFLNLLFVKEMSEEPRMEKQPEGEQKFESWLKESDFTPETVSALLAKGVTSQRILACLSQTDIDDFKLNLGQRILLQNVVKTLTGRPQEKAEEVKVHVRGQTGGKAKTVVAARQLGKGKFEDGGKTEKAIVEGQTGGEADQVLAFDKADGKDLKDLGVWKGEESPKKPVFPKEEDCYKMTSTPRGHCYIFNNKNFKSLAKRIGTDNDKDGLKKIFEKKFQVSVFPDMSAADMKTEVKNLSEKPHSHHDCVVVIFLTHGSDGKIYGSDDKPVDVDYITSLFKADTCPSLAHKPKIFFFASCRGKTMPTGVDPDGPNDDNAGDAGQEIKDLVAPEAHFFLGYATVPGKQALRNPETGTWYIQSLIEVLEKSPERTDFLSMMTDMKRVLHKRQCETTKDDYYKQTAMSSYTLHSKIYLLE